MIATGRMRTMTTGTPSHGSFTLKLKDLLYEWDERTGLSRLIVMAKLRDYVAKTDYLTLIDEIHTIDREDWLNVLIGVGMRGGQYYAVVGQKAKIMGLI